MATIRISIDTGNAAFEDGNMGNEIGRILTGIADRLKGYDESNLLPGITFPLRDVNGNKVGKLEVRS